jgi:Fungal Zn(2)-Cys(6) binuclear cluster domain
MATGTDPPAEEAGFDADSPQDEQETMGPPDSLGGPTPKRRRVTRACDECRRKKIKCDGKQVCYFR